MTAGLSAKTCAYCGAMIRQTKLMGEDEAKWRIDGFEDWTGRAHCNTGRKHSPYMEQGSI